MIKPVLHHRREHEGVPSRPVPRMNDGRHLIESLRAVLAIIAGLLMLDMPGAVGGLLALGVIGFSIYAGALLWFSANRQPLPLERALHWLDVCWFLLLIALAGDAGIRYFLFMFFPVLFASWRSSLRESTLLAACSGLAALILFALRSPEMPWAKLLALPLALMVTGPLVAALAYTELNVQQGFAFVAGLVESVDPRRGFDAIMPVLIERIALEFGATGALLVVQRFEGPACALCWETGEACTQLPGSITAPLLEQVSGFSAAQAFCFRVSQHRWQREYLRALNLSGVSAEPDPPDRERIVALARFLDQPCLMSVPLSCRSIGRMRLILTSPPAGLRAADFDVLVHAAEQLGPSIENALLLERLSSEAVDSERARIGRDLHDSAIQPYIGLKFAVEALVREAGPDNSLFGDLQRLQEMTSSELAAMRDVVTGLRGKSAAGGALLASAVQRQALRFGQLFGVDVTVDVDGNLPVDRRIAGDLFHLVAEGLSNIRRHTLARRAWISLACREGALSLRIRNEHGGAAMPPNFMPRSLSERAAVLGGDTCVDIDAKGSTVRVTIPLE